MNSQEKATILDDKLHWYKDAIIYELHIKAFYDSDGDGIGDFNGLLQKLDYLQELGVTAVWVLPFYPSPLKDDGYDIADYYSINPRYGDIDQFKKFLDEAHSRNLKVITELVVNHTSDQHPWFQRARYAPKDSPERNYYVWSDDPTKYKDVRIIFQDFEASNWTWDPVAQQYYWHRFFHHQPDLNYDSTQVQEEIVKVLDYWCAMGVDGFRLDAVPYLFEREGTNGENLPETHVFLKKLRKYIDERYPGICFLAEANMWPEDSASYFGDGDECHMNYHFPVMPRMFMALQREDRYPITDIFDQTPAIPETCQWAMFLRNHDELTLEMVTDEERDYMYKVYAKDPKARINLGIRHRLAPLMENDRKRIELMNSLLFSLPGTPVIYYGDEIGMGDNFYLGDRDGVRTPMQWSPDRNAGFSSTNPQQLYLPVILDPQYHYESVNVETQRGNTSSLFWFMKRIIHMRKKYKAFSRGDMQFIYVDNPKVLAFTRTYEDETLLIVVNLSKYAQPAEIDLKKFRNYIPQEAFSKNAFPAIKENSPYFFTLAPHSFQWFVLQKPAVAMQTDVQHSALEVDRWESLFENTAVEQLESTVLPAYIQRMDWFATNKKIHSLSIAAHTSLPADHVDLSILLIEVNFESGLPEMYHLPVTFIKETAGRKLMDDHPSAIIALLRSGDKTGFLADAVYTTSFQQTMFQYLAGNKRFMGNGEVVFYTNGSLQPIAETLQPRVHLTNKVYTSITYSSQFFLKIYRRVDKGMHPDVELTRHLSETGPGITTQYGGGILWNMGAVTYNLAMLEKLEENHGDGYSYMHDRVANYIERILARDRTLITAYKKEGTLSSPVAFETLDEERREFIGSNAADVAKETGSKLAQIHKALANGTGGFIPEEFSLHYQRSLFSSMTTLVRETTESIGKQINKLPQNLHGDLRSVINKRENILHELKKVYRKKFDVLKIRIHGNMNLRHVLLTGKDLLIHDFAGNPLKPFSTRRLKRSPLRDVAAMIHSFYYVAYEGILSSAQVPADDHVALLPFADLWAHYMSSFFLNAYIEGTNGIALIPATGEDFDTLLNCFLLEHALQWFNYELNHHTDKAAVLLRVLETIMKQRDI
jgi:maltose alpha-D-glucosyltransferase/alpha-amylase